MWLQLRPKLFDIKTCSSFSQSTIHVEAFQFTARDGQNQITKKQLPLELSFSEGRWENKYLKHYLSLSCPASTCTMMSISASFQHTIQNIVLILKNMLSCTERVQNIISSPFILNLPLSACVMAHRLASSDTFPFPQLVWSCQHPLAPVCIPAYWDNTLLLYATCGGSRVMGEMHAWCVLWWCIFIWKSGLWFTHWKYLAWRRSC